MVTYTKTCRGKVQKKKGQYFTPEEVVTYIVDSVLNAVDVPEESRFLDPACGSGQFLLILFRHLLDLHLRNGKPKEEAIHYIINNQLTGFDIDPIAVDISKANLSLISGIDKNNINIHHKDFLFHQNLLDENNNEVTDQWDVILGNPPWGSTLTNEKKKFALNYFSSARSGINTFTLFIERAIDYVSETGTIAFLIPEAYLNIKAHRKSRELVLNYCQIKELTIWGEQFKGVFAPSISIILSRENNLQRRNSNVVQIRNDFSISEKTATVIPQAAYHRTHENIFNINYTRKCVNILSIIEEQDCFYLKDNSRFYLGIVTGNNQKHISSVQSDKFPDPILLGKDLEQYRINFSNNYFKYNKENLQQVAPDHLYKIKNKILYKFIGKRLTFALDHQGYYSLNNINGFIPEKNPLSNQILVSLLNSDLMQYYYENSFFTLKVLRGNLEKLPLMRIKKDNQGKLQKLAEQISYTSGDARFNMRENIEDIIFSEYKIKDREAYIISNR